MYKLNPDLCRLLQPWCVHRRQIQQIWKCFLPLEWVIQMVSSLVVACCAFFFVAYIFVRSYFWCCEQKYWKLTDYNGIAKNLWPVFKYAELEQAAALKYLYGWLRHHPKYGTLVPPELSDSLYYADVSVIIFGVSVHTCAFVPFRNCFAEKFGTFRIEKLVGW